MCLVRHMRGTASELGLSEVFKGSKVHDFEYYDERNYVLKWKFDLCH